MCSAQCGQKGDSMMTDASIQRRSRPACIPAPGISEEHLLTLAICDGDEHVHVVLKGLVEEGPGRQVGSSHRGDSIALCAFLHLLERGADEVQLGGEHQNRRVCRRARKVGILGRVAGIRAGESHRVRREARYPFVHHDEVPLRLGHLLRVDEDVPVCVHAPGPQVGPALPHFTVVEQSHCEVVRNQILGRDAQVHRVPVLELRPELLEHLRVGRARLVPAEEDVVPDVLRVRLRRHVGRANLLPVQVGFALQQVRDGVVRHVDRAVGQALDDPALIPGEERAQPELPAAGPLAEPPDPVLKLALDGGRVRIEGVRRDVIHDLLRPFLVVVAQIPLLGERHDALIPRARHDLGLRLPVGESRPGCDHIRPDASLDVLHRIVGVGPDQQDAIRKALQIDLVLRGGKLFAVIRALDAELLAHRHGRHVAIAGDLDDRDHLEVHHVRQDVVLLGVVGLVLQLLERRVVVGGVGRHRRHNARALPHADRQQRKGVHRVIGGLRRVQRKPKQVPPADVRHEALELADPLRFQLLIHHALGSSLAHDEHVAALDLVRPVLSVRQHEAVRLAVHRLRTQGGGGQEDVLAAQTRQLGVAREGVLRYAQLDDGVLLRGRALSARAVMVRADLPVQDAEDAGPAPILDAAAGAQLGELPADERVVVGVDAGGDEAAAPVTRDAKGLEIHHPIRREVLQPLQRVHELGNLRFRHHALEDVPLAHDARARLGDQLGLLALALLLGGGLGSLVLQLGLLGRLRGGKLRRAAEGLEFVSKLVGGRLNGHARAVEAEGKQHIAAFEALVVGAELRLGHAEGVAKMQAPIHVGIRESHQEFAVAAIVSAVRLEAAHLGAQSSAPPPPAQAWTPARRLRPSWPSWAPACDRQTRVSRRATGQGARPARGYAPGRLLADAQDAEARRALETEGKAPLGRHRRRAKPEAALQEVAAKGGAFRATSTDSNVKGLSGSTYHARMYIAQRPDLLRNGVSRSQGTSPANASRGPQPRRKLRRKRRLLARAEPSAEPLGRAWATMRALLAQLLLWLCYAAASRSQ
eukprot:scaffold726_cov262-Pinguiococcus_pyrenoidosus.AAC.1